MTWRSYFTQLMNGIRIVPQRRSSRILSLSQKRNPSLGDKPNGQPKKELYRFADSPIYKSPTAPRPAALHARNLNPTYTRTPNETQLTNEVEANLADGDIHGALRLLTSEDTIAPHNKEIILVLAEKHPSHLTPTTFSNPPTELIEVPEAEEKELKAIIATFPSGSAGGIDGMRPQILKDLLTVKEEGI
ncbi:hypothetical protein ILUMI_19674 [Ignelater luminosus]|uniref:Uncharacterized protein n=1 Tax=Ignelater luminosus TaxID=2038154 RepID=A0A8K0FZN5_IGNLU|nr:hypothetical protein ILUMI_19674 [Ignelater luminosus]